MHWAGRLEPRVEGTWSIRMRGVISTWKVWLQVSSNCLPGGMEFKNKSTETIEQRREMIKEYRSIQFVFGVSTLGSLQRAQNSILRILYLIF